MYNSAFNGQLATNQRAFSCLDTAGMLMSARAGLAGGGAKGSGEAIVKNKKILSGCISRLDDQDPDPTKENKLARMLGGGLVVEAKGCIPGTTGYPNADSLTNLPKNGVNTIQIMTTGQAREMAKKLGYRETNFKTSQQQKIFFNPKAKKAMQYISQDVGSANNLGPHNGGVWKAGSSIEKLFNRETRTGTFDANLNYIGK